MACIGRPLIIMVCLSGPKCAANVVWPSHMYACLAMAAGLPRAGNGGGGKPGVGLWAKRGATGGRRPCSRCDAMTSRTRLEFAIHGGCATFAKNAALCAPLTWVESMSSSSRRRFGGGSGGSFGLSDGFAQTPGSADIVAHARPNSRCGLRGLSESCYGGEMMGR